MLNLVIFVSGVATGVCISLLYGLYQLKKINDAKQDLLSKLKKKAEELRQQTFDAEEKKNSIRERLTEAVKLAEEQLALRAQAEMPSKNSLHSKYQNGLIYQIKELEKKKIEVLRSILKDGFDPMITVLRDGGEREEIPLSAYIAQSDDNSDYAPPANASGAPKKAGKFVIYKGGKDDGETTH